MAIRSLFGCFRLALSYLTASFGRRFGDCIAITSGIRNLGSLMSVSILACLNVDWINCVAIMFLDVVPGMRIGYIVILGCQVHQPHW